VGPQFSSGQALHGYASVSLSGAQGLTFHAKAIDQGIGPSVGGLRLDPGIRGLLSLPSLAAWVEFPYLGLGDDFYSSDAMLWTSPRLTATLAPGHDPGPCARGEAHVSAAVGTTFQLLGIGGTISATVYDHPLSPVVSIPGSPDCLTS